MRSAGSNQNTNLRTVWAPITSRRRLRLLRWLEPSAGIMIMIMIGVSAATLLALLLSLIWVLAIGVSGIVLATCVGASVFGFGLAWLAHRWLAALSRGVVIGVWECHPADHGAWRRAAEHGIAAIELARRHSDLVDADEVTRAVAGERWEIAQLCTQLKPLQDPGGHPLAPRTRTAISDMTNVIQQRVRDLADLHDQLRALEATNPIPPPGHSQILDQHDHAVARGAAYRPAADLTERLTTLRSLLAASDDPRGG